MQGKEFLRSLPSFEAQLASLLLPCGSMRLLDQSVAPGRRHDLDVLHAVEHGKCPHGRPRAPELVGVDDLRNLVLTEQSREEGSCGRRIPVGLEQDVEDGTVLVDGPPEPVRLSPNLDVHLVQKPPGTPPGFPVAQFLSQERGELDVPLPQRFVTDHDATLVKHLLNVTLAEREPVVEPQRVADDAQGKTVAVWLSVTHSSLRYRG